MADLTDSSCICEGPPENGFDGSAGTGRLSENGFLLIKDEVLLGHPSVASASGKEGCVLPKSLFAHVASCTVALW